METASKSKTKVPTIVHRLLKHVLDISEFGISFSDRYTPNYENFCIYFTKEEYNEILSFVQSVSAGDL